MNQENIKKMLKKANEYIKDLDVVIDPYDMTYVWVSDNQCNISEYSAAEQIDKQIAMNISIEHKDVRNTIIEDITNNTLSEKKLFLKTKTGEEKILMVESMSLLYNNQPYLIGRIKQVKKKE
jgi:hypothetical protein